MAFIYFHSGKSTHKGECIKSNQIQAITTSNKINGAFQIVWNSSSEEDEREDRTLFQLLKSPRFNSIRQDEAAEERIYFVKVIFKSTHNYLLLERRAAIEEKTQDEANDSFEARIYMVPVMKHDPMLFANDTTAVYAYIEGHFDRHSCLQGLVRGYASWWHDVITPSLSEGIYY